MPIVRKTLAEAKAKPFKFTPKQRARMEAMSDEEIERDAASDLDAPLWTDEQLDRAAFARNVRQTRARTGLSQAQFSKRFCIALDRLQDWEQGRSRGDSAAAAYLKVIAKDPDAVQRALDDA